MTLVKKIVEATGGSIIPPTQNQEYHNLQNNLFATPNNATSSRSSTPSHSHTHTTGKEKLLNSMFEEESDDEISDLTMLEEKIENELIHYKASKLSLQQKKDTSVLTWWKSQKVNFPCLFQALRALLATPATSVPSECIFSEAGYIARARRSRILPRNLNKYIFIKKKLKIGTRA